ncbi:hypothetical protein [Paraburkholderia sp. RAU2J]|uniref:hypothetical protein n=1 Tax=Paraburkholderia sp. RAU2J TaxID=1938810 RepID=UPI0018F33391|nr:hypothetical protein [Paraburkholderia sp. RAU2J]
MAAAAAKAGGKIVLCAVESAIESTRRLFEQHVSDRGTSVSVIHVAWVWTLFKNGDLDECFAAVAASADEAYEAGATAVAFAHPGWRPRSISRATNAERSIAPMLHCEP